VIANARRLDKILAYMQRVSERITEPLFQAARKLPKGSLGAFLAEIDQNGGGSVLFRRENASKTRDSSFRQGSN
jgi:hypothetical protein